MPVKPSRSNLMRLFMLRTVMIVFLLSIALILFYLHIPLPTLPIALAMIGMVLLNVISLCRLNKNSAIHESELFLQLLADVLALTVLFYFTGGYSNPLVWMYLLPLSVATVTLKRSRVFVLALLTILSYTLLVFYYQPISHLHMHFINGRSLDIHLVGMWLGFVISAGIIALFVTGIGSSLREYDLHMAMARERVLESERVLALGTLATAAAHELGTPLSTMAVVTQELANDYPQDEALQASIKILSVQISHCKSILASLSNSTGQTKAEQGTAVDVYTFLMQTLHRWQDIRPAVKVDYRFSSDYASPMIAVDRTLSHALINLLDNAADASQHHIEISGTWDKSGDAWELEIKIRDFGPGVNPKDSKHLGTPFFSTKAQEGLGLGLYLSQLIFQRFGGSVRLEKHPEQGTMTHIQLPLDGLILKV